MGRMTQVLILGGTGWLSGRVAQAWLARGADVTCLARGGRPVPVGATLAAADRSAADAYAAVATRDWDEVVDVSSSPAHVAGAVVALGDRAAHWSYVSSISVYADADVAGADESAALAEPAAPGEEDDYSRAKSAAERSVRALADRAAIVRPGLIVGPGDPTDRFGYWVARFALAGDGAVLVPDAPEARTQVIDVDDLTAFLVDAGARGWAGTVNAIGPSAPLVAVLAAARRVAGHTGAVVATDPAWLTAHAVAHWAGERSLPLWLPADLPGFATRDVSAYAAAGGGIRPLEETLARVLADERARGLDRPRRAGLTRADELALLAQR